MNKKYILIIVVFILLIIISGGLYLYLINRNQARVVSRGLYGTVSLSSGNCMPSIGSEKDSSCKSTPVSRMIYIRKPAMSDQLVGKTQLVEKVKSSANGSYQVSLPSGEYTISVDDNGSEYCNSFDDQGACLVEVGSGRVRYDINIDHASY